MSDTLSNLTGYISQIEQQYNIPNGLLGSLLNQESGLNPNAYNASSGAEGIAQVLPSTASDPGYGVDPLSDPYDPVSSINFAGQYLSALYQNTGSWTSAVQSYGTVPNNGSGMTTGQAQVAQIANNADNSSNSGWSIGSILSNIFNGPTTSIPGSGTFLGGLFSGPNDPYSKQLQNAGSGLGIRIAIAALAGIFILIGLGTIAFGSVSRGANKILEKVPIK